MSDTDRDDTRNVVMVAKVECLRCRHLAGALAEEEFPCFDDDICPAKFYRISLGIPINKHATKLAEAMADGNAANVSKLTKQLSGLDPVIVAKVMALASGMLREGMDQ